MAAPLDAVDPCPVCLTARAGHEEYDGQRTVCPIEALERVRLYGDATAVADAHRLRPSGWCTCGERVVAFGLNAHLLAAFGRAGLEVVRVPRSGGPVPQGSVGG